MNDFEGKVHLTQKRKYMKEPPEQPTDVCQSHTQGLSGGITRIVGYFQKNKTYGFVIPDNRRFTEDIFIPGEKTMGAVTGHKVVAELTSYGGGGRKPEGKIVEILGHIDDPGTDILSIIKDFGIPLEFDDKILRQAANVAKEVSAADMAGRKDLRKVQMVTIDGEDAKDLDDAVSLTKEGDIWHLGVHIADVANYVQENSALDREAKLRGASVYLVDRVIPMLPHKLSNGICSLNAGEDRLALSCLMDIDSKGNVIGHEIAETVICVDERMSYTSVKKILTDHDPKETDRYRALVPMFEEMAELASVLRAKRRKKGAIDFDFPETKVILDEEGHPVDMKPYERNVATRLIEEFMLITNETVAEDYFWQEIPFLYRSHEAPEEKKMKELAAFIRNFGYTMHIRQDPIHPKEVQKLLDKTEGSPEEALISRLTLRSMKQARYTPEAAGHFGLSSRYYCHFTSPIRRYPDLQIHRIIKDNIRGRMDNRRMEHYAGILDEVGRHSSEMERRADEAERETIKLKKAEYMKRFIGESFEGVISGVTKWGIYVELPNTAEGLVHVTRMHDDYYNYIENMYQMVGERTGRTYSLGQKVRVKVAGIDTLSRTIDFELDEREESHSGKGTGKAYRQ